MYDHLEPLRMFSGALNKSTGGRKAYDRVIEPVSKAMVLKIISMLEREHFEIFHEKRIVDNRTGKESQPDLIVFDKASSELFIVDYKHMLNPFGPSEVIDKMNEFDKSIRQIRSYMAAANYSNWVQSLKPSKLMCMLVFRYPMLIPMQAYSDVVITHWDLLIEKLSPNFNGSLSELLNSIKLLPEKMAGSLLLYNEWFEIKVSDWTYRRSILVGD